MSHLIMYIALRRDLITSLNWPIGATVAQAAHASTAVLWEHRTDSNVIAYMERVDSMRKVVLECPDEESLKNLSETFTRARIDHTVEIEKISQKFLFSISFNDFNE